MEKQILEILVDIKSDIKEMKVNIAKNTEDISELNKNVAKNTKDIEQNTRDITKMKKDIAKMKDNIEQNTENIAILAKQRRIDSINISKILETQVKQDYAI